MTTAAEWKSCARATVPRGRSELLESTVRTSMREGDRDTRRQVPKATNQSLPSPQNGLKRYVDWAAVPRASEMRSGIYGFDGRNLRRCGRYQVSVVASSIVESANRIPYDID